MTIGHTRVGHGDVGVLVLHGWFGDHGVYAPILPYLDVDTFSYAFIDYRGYGRSRGMPGEYSMREIAADAIGLADELGWQSFHAIGHSMGGSALQRIMVDAGGRLRSGVCLTPVPASGVPMEGEQLALFEGAAANDANRAGIIGFSTGNRLSQRWVESIVAHSRATVDDSAFAAYFKAWAGTDFVAEARGNTTPLLVAVGEHDLALTPDVMRATFLDWYPNTELAVIPNSGHYPMQETPVYLVTLCEDFLRRQMVS